MDASAVGIFVLGFVLGVVVTAAGVGWLVVNEPWRRAASSGVAIPWTAILGMRLRGTPPGVVVDATVALAKRGRPTPWETVEAVYLAHGTRRMDGLDLAAAVDKHVASAGTDTRVA